MKITEKELNIKNITLVSKGRIPPSKTRCDGRVANGFAYVLSGFADYNFNGKIVRAEKGDILFLALDSHYAIDVACDNYTFIFVNFFFDEDGQLPLENEVYKASSIMALDDAFIKLHKIWLVNTHANIMECKSLLYHIYSVISTHSVFSYVSGAQRQHINKAVQILTERSCDGTLNLSEIARQLDMSDVHFRRLFKQIYKMSPSKFVQNIRIERAKQLLIDIHLPISEISEKCGYQDPFYFSRAFKSVTGMKPSEYRKSSKTYY